MKSRIQKLVWALCTAACTGSGATPTDSAREPTWPIEAFARIPAVKQVALSPDGKSFAALVEQDGQTFVAIQDLLGGSANKPAIRTDNQKLQFNWVHWVNDNRLLVSMRFPGERGWVDTTVETRLMAMDADGTHQLKLDMDGAQHQDQVIDWIPDDGHNVFVRGWREDRDHHRMRTWVEQVNVDNGFRVYVPTPVGRAGAWVSDYEHNIRLVTRPSKTDGMYEVVVGDPDKKRWRSLWTFPADSAQEVEPLGFGKDGWVLYVAAEHQGRRAVFSVDLHDAEPQPQLLLSDANDNVGTELLIDYSTGSAVGVTAPPESGAATGFWDPAWKSLKQKLDAALPERFNRILQITNDGKRYLLFSSGNGVPGEYYVGERATGRLTLIGQEYPELVGRPVPKKQAITIKARDGVLLPAFLTLPPGAKPGAVPPAVLLPHGGPQSQDTIDFDPLPAFLATRGYAVLQVNFRGSEGMGADYSRLGFKRWGLDMQDDLVDATHWLGLSGTADAKRICIVGASYGGYAALMGAVKTPELYRCIVSFGGVSDLIELGEFEDNFYGGKDGFEHTVGKLSWWSDDRERLKQTSPRRHADLVQAPVLLVHGTQDAVVPIDQSEMMYKALRSEKKDVRFVRQEGGDHWLSRPQQRIELYRELETFLAHNLGDAPSPVDRR